MHIRPTEQADIPGLQTVLDQTELFPSEMLPDMLTKAGEACWLTCLVDDAPRGFCFAEPEDLTDGTWNMRAIAVSPDLQGQGCGTAIVAQLEHRLRTQGQRLLIVDTSGSDAFAPTRRFYSKAGYVEEARIRGFWATGEDKIVFVKGLT